VPGDGRRFGDLRVWDDAAGLAAAGGHTRAARASGGGDRVDGVALVLAVVMAAAILALAVRPTTASARGTADGALAVVVAGCNDFDAEGGR
jgi:hypothetical protein